MLYSIFNKVYSKRVSCPLPSSLGFDSEFSTDLVNNMGSGA